MGTETATVNHVLAMSNSKARDQRRVCPLAQDTKVDPGAALNYLRFVSVLNVVGCVN